MPQDPGVAPASDDSTVIPLHHILALHRALISARARLPVLDDFLDAVLDILSAHLIAGGALIGLYDADRGGLCHVHARGAVPPIPPVDLTAVLVPCQAAGAEVDRQARALAWATDLARGTDLQVLAAGALVVRDEEIGLVCLFGDAEKPRFAWQQEGLSGAALEISLAVSHLRLRRSVEERLRERSERWSALYEIAVSLTRVLDSDALLDELVRRTVLLLRARGGSLSVTDEATGETVITVAYLDGEPAQALIGHRLPPGEGLAAQVMRSGRTLHLPDYQFVPHPNMAPGLRTSVIAAPLFVQGAPAGTLAIGDNPSVHRFTQDDIQTVELLAQAACAILERLRGRSQDEVLTIHRERARLARELHDGLAQNLATLLLKAELCHDIAASGEPELARQIDLLAEGIQQAVRETRAAIASLHETPSDRERLMDALSLLASRFESQTRIPVSLSWEGDAHRSFPASAQMALLRVAQEALANVRKHACAQSVCVNLNAADPKTVELSVHDDGCGFNASNLESLDNSLHFGLRGMRGRIEDLGGSLRVETAPGCGVMVSATLPLTGPERQ